MVALVPVGCLRLAGSSGRWKRELRRVARQAAENTAGDQSLYILLQVVVSPPSLSSRLPRPPTLWSSSLFGCTTPLVRPFAFVPLGTATIALHRTVLVPYGASASVRRLVSSSVGEPPAIEIGSCFKSRKQQHCGPDPPNPLYTIP